MNERIRLLREDKALSRAAFGEKLGVSGDVINNLERGRVEPKDHIIKLICAEYSVNEEWLRYGTGTMYIQPDTFSLDNFVKARGATELELEIVKTYFELDPEIRKAVVEHFKKRLTAASAETTEQKIQREVDSYRAELELEARQVEKLSATGMPGDDLAKEA